MRSSPLFKALNVILHGFPPARTGQLASNPNICVLDYSDEATFGSLWLEGLQSDNLAINGSELDWNNPDQQVLIIGNEPPESIFRGFSGSLASINFRTHFTATSWLAAWKVAKFNRDEKIRKKVSQANSVVVDGSIPQPVGGSTLRAEARIAVIDPRDARLASGAARALQPLFSSRDAAGQFLVPRAAVLNVPNLDEVYKWLESSKADQRATPSSLAELIKVAIWNELTSDREQNHALSNVLGALLLSSQVGAGQTHLEVQDYLLALVQACGVEVALQRVNVGGKQGTSQRWLDFGQQSSIPGAILIDDMGDIWRSFVAGALGVVERQLPWLELFGSSDFPQSIRELPNRLRNFSSSGRRRMHAGDILGSEHHDDGEFVLFLDLRLFTKGDALEEEAFYNALRDLGKDLLQQHTQRKRRLSWLNNKAAVAEFNKELIGDGVHPRETLLPRLISLLDPTLPIVIFSSTHRTELIEPFQNYGNIITGFYKPVLTVLVEDWPTIVKGLYHAFTAVMEKAARILRVRKSFQELSKKTLATQGQLPGTTNGWLIEIFVDESEEPTTAPSPRAICAGGVIVVRPLDEQGLPVVSDTSLFESLAGANCLWGWCTDTPKNFEPPENQAQQRGFMPKGAVLNFEGNGQGAALFETMINNIRNALGNNSSIFPFAVISRRADNWLRWMRTPDGVSSEQMEKVFDATLRMLIQHSLEVLLFRSELLKSALKDTKSRIAVDLGIRDYPCRIPGKLIENFGIEVILRRNGPNWRPSFHSEDGYLITSETISRTGIPWPYDSSFERARAVALWDFGGNKSHRGGKLPKQLHYFADAIAHVALYDLEVARAGSQVVDEFFASGWIADLRADQEEIDRLEIGRAWDQDDQVFALRAASKLKYSCPSNGLKIDVFSELDRDTARLGGATLRRLFAKPG